GYSINVLDVPRQMTLIGESGLISNFTDGELTRVEQFSCFPRPRFDDIPIWRLTGRLLEQHRKMMRTHVDCAGDTGNRQIHIGVIVDICGADHQFLSGQPGCAGRTATPTRPYSRNKWTASAFAKDSP